MLATNARRVRVVSVLPSATEMLCAIGGEQLLVGRSHEDNYPESIACVPVVTGQRTSFTTAAEVDAQVSAALKQGDSLYTLDVEKICELHPDVILTQDICAVCAIDLQTVQRVAARMSPAPNVVSLNPDGVSDVLRNIVQVGDAVGMGEEARATVIQLEQRISAVDVAIARRVGAKLNVAFIEWPDPLYVGGHWTPQLIVRAGGNHPLNPPPACGGGASKSFAVSHQRLAETDPDLIIFCPCGLDLVASRREAERVQCMEWWQSLRAVKAGRVALVDGDAMFNRPGPRLVDAFEWLATVLHDQPGHPSDFPVEWLSPPKEGRKEETTAFQLAEIEEAHRAAVVTGAMQYVDPKTGYTVFTQLKAIARGYCCGSGCRHCPYGHKNVPSDRRQQLDAPITINLDS
mmetsp:Transcript_41893/g.98170  ORF Transcript_41893/g.98170 Transcript_41893/m.98170 type:complete len:403 (-) Transcript_41893:313-1521(-)